MTNRIFDMKKLIFKFLLLLIFSMNWELGYGQNFPKPDTINGIVVVCSAFLTPICHNPEFSQMNSTIYSAKSPGKKFNVLDNNPYDLYKIKIDPVAEIPYNCGRGNTNFDYIHRIHPKLALSQNDSFDFLSFSYEIVRGTAFTIVAYGLVANVGLDEGDYVARKAIYTFAVIDKNNTVKWYRDISIPTNNFNISYSKDGKFAVIPGSRIEKETILNHIYLVSLEDKKVIYNFLPINEESVLYDTQLKYKEAMIISPKKINKHPEERYYFDTKSKTLYKTMISHTNSDKISYVNTVNIWDEKTNKMLYYDKNDILRLKVLFFDTYKKVISLNN